MPGFNAGSVVEPLDYDFNPYIKAEGVIKEPTDKQIGGLLASIKDLGKKITADAGIDGLNTEDPFAVMLALENLDPDVFVTVMGDMAATFSELCSGHPTKTQILGLPLRVRMGFYTWLMSEVINPEASTGAGSGATPTPMPAAAGQSST